MPGVAIVTDSTTYLPRDMVRDQEIHEVSLYISWPDGQERESEMDFDAFYARLRTGSEMPTTSQPSIGDFIAVYEPLVAAGRDVLSIHISGGISGTVQAARQAAEQLAERGHPGRIEVMDSETTCGGLGMVVLAAAKRARAGGDLESVREAARHARSQLKIWFVLDTLEYLQRGGRIGKAQAFVGTALKIKPVLTLEAEIVPVARVRTSGRAFERMVECLRERQADGADGWVVQHIQAPDRAERMVERGREIFGTEPVWVSEMGPVMGAHSGPGVVGVGGIPRALYDPAL
jgi:DegV family protein with EDD domain